MSELTIDGVRVFLSHGQNEYIYFNPAQTEDMERIEPIVKSWEKYKIDFEKQNDLITASQYNWLI